MSGLPEGWAHATLSLLCKQPEQRVPLADEMFTYIDIASVDRDLKTVSEPQRLLGADAPSRARKLVESGDVIVSMTRPNLNAVALIGEQYNDCVASTGFEVLKPIEVEPRWIFAAVRSTRFVNAMCEKVQGALYPAVKSADIREFEIPLPPLAEQTRIAQKLDELLAQVDTLRARIDALPAQLKRFRQSVLATAVSGRLTEEWRAQHVGWVDEGSPTTEPNRNTARLDSQVQPNLRPEYITHEIDIGDTSLAVEFPTAWPVKKLKEICQVISGFAFSSSDFINQGVPVVKISNVQYGVFEEKNQEYLPNNFVELHSRYLVNSDDLLMALTRPITNNTLKICRYPKIASTALLNQRVCKFQFIDNTARNFSEWLFQSEYFKSQVIGHLSQTLQPNLSPKDLSNFVLGIPPAPEQTEIVCRGEQLFAFADQLEAKVASAKSRIDLLTQSILAKAFRGELVPQDPNDEPASLLLERIQAQRASAPKPKRGRKASA